MMRLVAALCLLILSANLHALAPDDFVFGFKLQLSGQAALYELSLPQRVYQGVTRPDLYDVRVFNHQGVAVPHVFRRQAPPDPTRVPTNLPLFPLPAVATFDPNNVSLYINTDAGGRVLGVAATPAVPNESAAQHYLVDASALTQMPDKLLLVWDAPPGGFTATMSVEHSEDLKQWEILEPQVALMEILFEGRTFSQREIDLPPVRVRYLRLRWLSGASAVRLASVQALFAPTMPPLPAQWTPVSGQRVVEAEAQARNASVYLFDAPGFFPIDRVRVRLPSDILLVEAALLSRATPTQPWQERYRGALYQMRANGVAWQNTTLSLFPTTDRYWRLEVDERNGGLSSGLPSIEIGWIAQNLVFVAQGAAPFTLAYGSSRITTPSDLKDPLLNDIAVLSAQGQIKQAAAGENIALGRASLPGLPWKTWLRWAALAIGMLALVILVRRLYRKKKKGASS